MIYSIIQARMGSTRLPGKVMINICHKPILQHVIDRIKQSKKIDKIIVATSISIENDCIREYCSDHGIVHFSGSEDDVLDRYYQAAISNGVKSNDLVVRITADCPLIDPEVIDDIIERFENANVDYATNVIVPTYPDGLDCEVMKLHTLNRAWNEAKYISEREHVTLYIRNHPELFSLLNISNSVDYSSLRWTLDEIEDLELIKWIYEELYIDCKLFLMNDIIDLLLTKKNVSIDNSKYTRNEGLLKSLALDNKESNDKI